MKELVNKNSVELQKLLAEKREELSKRATKTLKRLWQDPEYKKFMHEKIENPDDALWIDRHHRGNLLEHYKDFLALFVTHGILFEDYVMEDKHEAQFVRKVLRPACHFIQRRFGLRPLIVPLVPKTFESDRFWLSYPEEVLDIVRENMGGK